jgi:hypothetical protein
MNVDGENIVFPTASGGIAGGSLFISKKAWDDIGGYKVMGVYAGDDGFLMVDMFNSGYCIQMAENIAIVHPPEDDIEYQKWKEHINVRDSDGKNKNIMRQVKEAEEFWKNRK